MTKDIVRRITCILALGVAVCPEVSGQFVRTAGRAVIMRTPAGATVSGVFVEAPQRPAPAVVLVPMLGGSKEDWDPVVERLVGAGMSALAVDLPSAAVPAAAEIGAWRSVVEAAVDYLSVRPDVQGSPIGVAGASFGATLAALSASADGRIRALALVSPAADYRGIGIEAAMKAYGSRPALLVAARGDPYAARTVRGLAAEPAGAREVLWSDAPAHGTLLFARQPDLAGAPADWFQRTLR